ncbi:MAG: DUF5678 domain-containing protein [Candidatus Edwardsbacteria bacterium]
MRWFASFPKELKKFRGKDVALMGQKVVAYGNNAITVLKKAKKSFPKGRLVLAFVPKEETLILL